VRRVSETPDKKEGEENANELQVGAHANPYRSRQSQSTFWIYLGGCESGCESGHAKDEGESEKSQLDV